MPTENSVVASLNEVRRLERDRVRREHEYNARHEADSNARREAEAREYQQAEWRRSQSHTAYGAGMGRGATQGHPSQGQIQMATAPGYEAAADPYSPYGAYRPRHTAEFGPGEVDMPGAGYGPDGYAGAPQIQTRTSWTAVVLVTLLMGGAGAAGYWKLNQDFQNKVTSVERARMEAEEARNVAVEAKARVEQEGKTKLTTCETQLGQANVDRERSRAMASVVPASPAVPQASEPEKKTAVKAAVERKAAPKRLAAVSRAREPEPAKKASAREVRSERVVMPKFAKRKSLSDDPLNGLKL